MDGLLSGLKSQSDINVVGAAGNVAEGLRICSAQKVDVLLLDLHLPDSPGISEMLTSFSEYCPVIVVLTAERRRAFVEAVLGMNVAGYLLKSAQISEIADAVRAAGNGVKPVLSKEIRTAETRLTPAEKDLLRLLAKGYKYDQIAVNRNSAPGTVKGQCEKLILKLGLDHREGLIAWASANGYGSLHNDE